MSKVPSFEINHEFLNPGIYIYQQVDNPKNSYTVFDLRFFKPNSGITFSSASAHTLEHLLAIYFRTRTQHQVITISPMGCLTGFVLALEGILQPEDIVNDVKSALLFCKIATSVPNKSKRTCGSAHLHDLRLAKMHATSYLNKLTGKLLHTQYPL